MPAQNNPHLAVCPDFTSEDYAPRRATLTQRQEAAAAASAAQAQEQEALEKEDQRKNAAKYLPHSDKPVPRTLPIIPSVAVIAKLRKGDYVPLYHFTRAGLKAVDRSAASEDSSSGHLTTDTEGSLVWTPILASKTARSVVPDSDLTFEEFSTATPRMLQAMITAGWPRERVSMFHGFGPMFNATTTGLLSKNAINDEQQRVASDRCPMV
ncbi:hypothetical protein BDZ97DRAFT_1767233 [Flammula alnicola]|nr:hypothetical protein BDZ97DRAFT_1767233 [Flammula alnicola]